LSDKIFREEQIQNSVYEHPQKRLRVGITNDESEPVPSQTVMSIPELLKLVASSGMVGIDTYDEVCGGRLLDGAWVLEFLENDISQFQVFIELVYPSSFKILKRPSEFPMLQENGDFLLQENGDKLLVQGLIP